MIDFLKQMGALCVLAIIVATLAVEIIRQTSYADYIRALMGY